MIPYGRGEEMTIKMPATTLHQPWATVAAFGYKTIETRSWHPALSLIGQRIAIHAGKRKMAPREWSRELYDAVTEISVAEAYDGEHFPKGAIVATAILKDLCEVTFCDPEYDPTTAWMVSVQGGRQVPVKVDGYGDFSKGRSLWILDDIRKLEPPIEAQGHQRIWTWTAPDNFVSVPALYPLR